MFFKNILTIVALISGMNVTYASEKSYDLDAINAVINNTRSSYQIPHASYVLDTLGGTSFYTFDGYLIVTISGDLEYGKKYVLIDKFAPNPKPIAFEIRRNRASKKAIALGGGLAHIGAFFTYDIYFYDKNGNELARVYYNGPIPATKESLKKYEQIDMIGNKKLDLSGLVEDETFLWTHPFTWFQRFKIKAA